MPPPAAPPPSPSSVLSSDATLADSAFSFQHNDTILDNSINFESLEPFRDSVTFISAPLALYDPAKVDISGSSAVEISEVSNLEIEIGQLTPSSVVNVPTTSKNPELIEIVRTGSSTILIPWCNEVEKMVSGMHFRASACPELMEYRLVLTKLLADFNDVSVPEGATMESLKERRMTIAKAMFGKLGVDCNVPAPFFVGCAFNLFLGDRVFMNRDVSIYNNAPVFIGDRTLLGPGVMICTDTHEIHPQIRREKGGSFAKSIRIGDDCWIGARTTILAGVTIGNGVIVGAGAVVTKDIAAMTVVGGVPARFIRRVV